jgi:hypothetical protein
MNKTKSKKLIRDVIIILLITVLILVAAELLLRLLYPRDDFQSKKISYQYDSELLISLRPDMERIFVRDAIDGGDTIHWRTNSDGFRHGTMKKGTKRVMVYGDSNVLGLFSDDKDTYSARLEEHLNSFCGVPFEVINAGVIGFGPDQCLLKFERDIPQYNPEIAVFVLFGHNDYGDLIRNRLFNLTNDSTLELTSHPRELDPLMKKPGVFAEFRLLDLVSKLKKKMGLEKPPTREEVTRITIRQYEDLCREQYAYYTTGGPNSYSHFFDNYDIDVAVAPQSASARVKVRLMKEVMKEIVRVASAANIRILFVVLPSAIDYTTNRSVSFVDLQRYNGYIPENLTMPMVTAGEALCVTTINLFELYKTEEPSSLYFRGQFNDHWTNLGQDIAARATAMAICVPAPAVP